MPIRSILVPLLVLILITGIMGCTTSAPPATSVPVAQSPAITSASPGENSDVFSLRVGSLTPGALLPIASTCLGASESPAVSWDKIPPGTKSLVLILDDPDAPSGTFTHWIVYNIPPVTGGFSAGQPNEKVLKNGANVGDNSAGSRGYYPVCPPIGSTHHYVFRLYAVDMDITQPTANRESIGNALSDHTIAKTEFVTIFRR
jgi:Raf kinase inhibitor-like YbhB/YbcL family protein